MNSERQTAQVVAPNTIIRILSTVVALPVIFAALYAGGWWFTVLILAVILVATLELTTIIHEGKIGIMTYVSLAYVVAVALSFAYGSQTLWLTITILGALGVFVAELWQPLLGRRDVQRTLVLVTLVVVLGHVAGFAIALRLRPDGLFWWLLVLIATFGADTLAFAGGRTYGRTPLLPEWSPKKTVEGTVTGVVGAAMIGMGALMLYRLVYLPTVLIVMTAPFFAVIGDLLESKFKRIYHVKDSFVRGLNIVPGHGGMLDRIDSLSLVLIFTYLALQLL
jgi:phosphatidate cytidylyltransferase